MNPVARGLVFRASCLVEAAVKLPTATPEAAKRALDGLYSAASEVAKVRKAIVAAAPDALPAVKTLQAELKERIQVAKLIAGATKLLVAKPDDYPWLGAKRHTLGGAMIGEDKVDSNKGSDGTASTCSTAPRPGRGFAGGRAGGDWSSHTADGGGRGRGSGGR